MKSKTKPRRETSPSSGSIRVSVSFPKNQYELLSRIAREKKVSTAWVVREAVDRYLEQLWPLLRSEQ